MQAEDVQKRVRQRPFKPFRLFHTDGTEYVVRHPEMVLLGRRALVLGLTSDPTQEFYDRSVDIDLFHIVRMEEVDSPAAAANS